MKPDPARILRQLYDADEGKYFEDRGQGAMMGPPAVGVADADDPWFARLKDIIGQFHWTAQEALAAAFEGRRARSVICWSMPIGEAARVANRKEDRFSSSQWALVRHHSTDFLRRMGTGLVDALTEMGYATVAPDQLPGFKVAMRESVGWPASGRSVTSPLWRGWERLESPGG